MSSFGAVSVKLAQLWIPADNRKKGSEYEHDDRRWPQVPFSAGSLLAAGGFGLANAAPAGPVPPSARLAIVNVSVTAQRPAGRRHPGRHADQRAGACACCVPDCRDHFGGSSQALDVNGTQVPGAAGLAAV